MLHSLFADWMAGVENRVVHLVMGCLAVIGGFLIGYILGWVSTILINRWAFKKKLPEQMKRAMAIIIGVILAVLVALFVFGEGGSGLFGGGGGDGAGAPIPADGGKDKEEKRDPPKEEPKKVDPPKQPDKPTVPGEIRVVILGGAEVKDDFRFYLVGGDPAPKNLQELEQIVAERQKAFKGEVMLIFRFKNERLTETHGEMKKLNAWLKEAKLLNRFE